MSEWHACAYAFMKSSTLLFEVYIYDCLASLSSIATKFWEEREADSWEIPSRMQILEVPADDITEFCEQSTNQSATLDYVTSQ